MCCSSCIPATACSTHLRLSPVLILTVRTAPPAGCETEGARLLRAICARLPDPAAIPALFDALAGTGNASVSTFELLSSGCVRALKSYLQVDRRGGVVGSGGASGWLSRWQTSSRAAALRMHGRRDCVVLPATWFSLRPACFFRCTGC